MKKILLMLVIALSGYSTYAQTNTFPASGNVGAGTTNPVVKLHVISDGGFNSNSSMSGVGFSLWRTSENTGGLQFRMKSRDEGISNLTFPAQIFANGTDVNVMELYTTGIIPLVFGTNTIEAMRISGNGNVGIGTNTPDTKLAVNGNIHTKGIKVDLIDWPDYVFKPTYRLPTLAEVKVYIDQNQHLLDIPSAKEIHANGLDLGEMNSLLIKKVEELTLYLIDEHDKNAKQEARIQALEARLEKIIP